MLECDPEGKLIRVHLFTSVDPLLICNGHLLFPSLNLSLSFFPRVFDGHLPFFSIPTGSTQLFPLLLI